MLVTGLYLKRSTLALPGKTIKKTPIMRVQHPRTRFARRADFSWLWLLLFWPAVLLGQALHQGMSRDDVILELGEPTAVMSMGHREYLTFGEGVRLLLIGGQLRSATGLVVYGSWEEAPEAERRAANRVLFPNGRGQPAAPDQAPRATPNTNAPAIPPSTPSVASNAALSPPPATGDAQATSQALPPSPPESPPSPPVPEAAPAALNDATAAPISTAGSSAVAEGEPQYSKAWHREREAKLTEYFNDPDTYIQKYGQDHWTEYQKYYESEDGAWWTDDGESYDFEPDFKWQLGIAIFQLMLVMVIMHFAFVWVGFPILKGQLFMLSLMIVASYSLLNFGFSFQPWLETIPFLDLAINIVVTTALIHFMTDCKNVVTGLVISLASNTIANWAGTLIFLFIMSVIWAAS